MNYKHSARAARICLFTTLFIIISCNKSEDSNEIVDLIQSPNILFIIADDLGKDAISGFTEGNIKPNTPNIDAIRNNGISFSNFWANPTCTP
ncbi:MAG: arylsulfatase B, partial [Polaribacter sp.]